MRQQLGLAVQPDQVLGLTHRNGSYLACSPESVEAVVKTDGVKLADNADTFLLRLANFPTIPPFLLAVIPTNHTDSGPNSVRERAQLLLDLATFINAVLGLRLVAHGCDGAGQALHKFLSNYPQQNPFLLRSIPDLKSETARVMLARSFASSEPLDISTLPLQLLSTHCVANVPFLFFQDAPHQLVRLFGSLKKHGFRLGNVVCDLDQFAPLLDRLPPNWLAARGLRASDFLNPVLDRMDVALPERILLNFAAPSTFQSFLEAVKPSPQESIGLDAFQYFAETVRFAILPFLDPEMAVLDRLDMLWRARCRILLMELDRELRMTVLHQSAQDNPTFTSACRNGINQNAESFFALVLSVIRSGQQETFEFYPWLLLSQSCEDLFRMLRFLGFSDRGMSIQELLERYNRLVPMQVLGLAQRPAHPKKCKRFDSSTKGGWIPPKLVSQLNKDDNEETIVEQLTFVTESEVHGFARFSSRLAPKIVTTGARRCLSGHVLTANKAFLCCSKCSRVTCKQCSNLPRLLWKDMTEGRLAWTCPDCHQANYSSEMPPPLPPVREEEAEQEVGEETVLKLRRKVPDLEAISAWILQNTVEEDRRMHTNLLALLASEPALTPPSQDLETLVRLRFPKILWTVTTYGPRRPRPNTKQQAVFGGQSIYVPMGRFLAHLVPKQRESSERTLRVKKTHPLEAAVVSLPKRRGPTEEEAEADAEVALACCGISSSQRGLSLVGCDSCEGWFCLPCLNLRRAPKQKIWYCPNCRPK